MLDQRRRRWADFVHYVILVQMFCVCWGATEPALVDVDLRRNPLLWTLTMLRMHPIALCAHNVYSANHSDPPTLITTYSKTV